MDDFAKYEQVHSEVNTRNGTTISGHQFLTGCELIGNPYEPLSYIYKEILPTPCLGMLAGPPKIGKSWYALNILHEVNQAGHCVVFMGNEDNHRRLQSRYKAIAHSPDDNVIFYAGLSNDEPMPKGKKAHDFIRKIYAKFNPSLIIIDTLEGIRDTNGKDNYSLSVKEFTDLRRLAHQLDIVILCVHHTRKKTDYEVEPLDSILGSQGIAATLDTILIMKAQTGTKDVNLFVTGKDVEQQDLALSWNYPSFSEPSSSATAFLGQAQEQVYEYIRDHPRCTQAAICGATDKHKSQVSKIVNQLIGRDLVLKKEGVLICSV